MDKIGFVFPGQGSQIVGMGKELYEETERGPLLFNRADKLLGYALSKICFEGPAEVLNRTEYTQPGIFVCSTILLELLREDGIEYAVVAGHSLGEYVALYAAGVFDFETGLHLVTQRGKLMQEAGEGIRGGMAAVIGLDKSKVEEICIMVQPQGIIGLANFNSPEQIVISGEEKAINAAIELVRTAGARRVIQLPVSGAFHSPLMTEAAEKMGQLLNGVELKPAEVDFLNNADARLVREPSEIKDSLRRQIISCVRWVDIIRAIEGMGYKTLIEVGPGRVLAGLIRKTTSALRVIGCSSLSDLEKVKEKIKNN